MNDAAARRLLGSDEPPAFRIVHADGRSPFVLICDHAGRRIPRLLGDLGVSAADLQRHVAWDIGAEAVALRLADALDAFAIVQTYSRLVIDCNRPLDSPASIIVRSENTDVPGNLGIDSAAAQGRAREIFAPYHGCIAAELDRRAASGLPAILVSVHSFTPQYHGIARPWHVGMLYGRDARVARLVLAAIRAEGEWTVGDNEPYAVSPSTDYAIPMHGERRGIPHVGLEIRQDLIEEAHGQDAWAARIARWLGPVATQFGRG